MDWFFASIIYVARSLLSWRCAILDTCV